MKPGSAMPSVRELARDLSINPATVAKGYQHLVDAGILAMKRGEGTFVAKKPPALPRGEREKELEGGAMRYASLAVTIGAPNDEAEDQHERDVLGWRGRSSRSAGTFDVPGGRVGSGPRRAVHAKPETHSRRNLFLRPPRFRVCAAWAQRRRQVFSRALPSRPAETDGRLVRAL